MIAGYHLIWTTYGSWLPNDPRGSSSHEIRCPLLVELGELYHGRKKIQPTRQVLRRFYAEATPRLQFEVLLFSNDDIALLARAFQETIHRQNYTCYGCAIMPDHLHLLIRKHRDFAETMIEHFQTESKAAMVAAGLRRATHPVWGGPGWKVYLDTRDDMYRIARYIELNPIRAGRPGQHWEFVEVYDGWLPGIGTPR